MTKDEKIKILKAALEKIIDELQKCGQFDEEAFDARDCEALENMPGFDFYATFVSIIAADALIETEDHDDDKG